MSLHHINTEQELCLKQWKHVGRFWPWHRQACQGIDRKTPFQKVSAQFCCSVAWVFCGPRGVQSYKPRSLQCTSQVPLLWERLEILAHFTEEDLREVPFFRHQNSKRTFHPWGSIRVCFFGLLSTRKQPCQLLQNKTFYPNKPSLTIGVQANNVTISVKRFHVFSRPGVQNCVWKKMSYYRERSPEEHKRKISCWKDADESRIEGIEKWVGRTAKVK